MGQRHPLGEAVAAERRSPTVLVQVDQDPQAVVGQDVDRADERVDVLGVDHAGREQAPFLLRYRDAAGGGSLLADAVIDASGTWTAPNPLGAGGILAELSARVGQDVVELGPRLMPLTCEDGTKPRTPSRLTSKPPLL